MSSKDEILANFQACAGIDDVGEALARLESCNWDLTEAINNILPDSSMQDDVIPMDTNLPENNFLIANRTATVQSYTPEIIEIDDTSGEATAIDLSVASTSFLTSQSTSEVPSAININIQVISGSTLSSTFPLEIVPTMTVGEFKTTLHKLVGIAPCNQVLEGFEKKVSSETVITTDILPKNKTLTLNIGEFASISAIHSSYNGLHQNDYHLLVHDETTKQDFSLKYQSSKIVKDIKNDVFNLTSIPVRSQKWTGWPSTVSNNMTLGNTGITKQHHFTVSKIMEPPRPAPLIDLENEDSPVEEYEDASDILPDEYIETIDIPSPGIPKSLISPDVCDEETGVTEFIEEFSKRYGEILPHFYPGNLESAVRDSLMVPAKSRRLLAVYLHEDKSVLCNVFCSQALCQPSVVEFLTANFVIWGWDMTHESNRARFLNLVSRHFGVIASSTVRSIDTNKLPAILLMSRTRSTVEVLSVIHGNSILDEVMTALLHSVEMFDDQRRCDLVDEEAREEREAMKAEQDAAYQASLVADRAKEEAKKEAAREERVERERQESIREQEEAIKQAVRESLEVDLPIEPSPDCKESITTLRFRTPDKEFFTRAFLLSTPLQVVLNYLCVKGYAADDYKCIQAWPRRDITNLDPSVTLKEHKIPPQESLTIEER